MEYWETTSADDAPHLTIEEKPRGLPEGATTHPLKLPFRDGALTLDQLELIAQLAESRKLPFIRLSQDQAAWLPAVKAKETSQVLAELGLLEESANVFKPVACVGASVCKIGALDSRAAAAKVSEALAKLDAPQEALLSFVKSLRISGCANSCSGHLVAPLGLQGSGKAGSGRFKILVGGSCGEGGAKIASAPSNWSVPEEKAGEFAAALAKAFVDSKAPSFPEWIEANAESVLAPWKGA
jgi:sulfite reductase beta subunit-like hemoprotein